MTWSLKLVNGDIAKGRNNSLATTKGSEKVVQDILAELREPFGTNPLTINFGSFLNEEEGTVVQLGNETLILPNSYPLLVVSEAERIISKYRRSQYLRLKMEIDMYGTHTFTDDEIIDSFEVNYQQIDTVLYLEIILYMNSGRIIELPVPTEAPPAEVL